MGICGKYHSTFEGANLASVVDISTDADYPHFFFEVLACQAVMVRLKSFNGEEFVLPRLWDGKSEYVEIEQSSSWEKLFDKPPTRFKVYPFVGERT